MATNFTNTKFDLCEHLFAKKKKTIHECKQTLYDLICACAKNYESLALEISKKKKKKKKNGGNKQVIVRFYGAAFYQYS